MVNIGILWLWSFNEVVFKDIIIYLPISLEMKQSQYNLPN